MKPIFARLLFAAAACGVVLLLGMISQDDRTVMNANPMKANQQQYDRIHDAGMFAQGSRSFNEK